MRLKKEWPELESNQRHKDFQSSALPTELSGQMKAQAYSTSYFLCNDNLYSPFFKGKFVEINYSK